MMGIVIVLTAIMVQSDISQQKPTVIGFTAILMWAALALLTKLSGPIPPFQLTAMSFTIAFMIGIATWIRDGGNPLDHLKLPKAVWTLGITGLFGYHFFYFLALQNAPAVEANLINYLWPLLIVLFSALLPGEQLRWFHVAGAIEGRGNRPCPLWGGPPGTRTASVRTRIAASA